MNTIELTQKLIGIPSYLGNSVNESKIGGFIFDYLKKFPWLEVIKQPVIGNRFNIIVRDGFPTRLLVCGHIDTVEPKSGWKTNPFKGVSRDGKIYGLGAADMKGNLAIMINCLENLQKTKGLMMLFYIDEEYDFLGTKKFLEEYKSKIKPKLVVSTDAGNLKVGLGCRGLIEISFLIQGQSGHAARPKSGNNAIDGAYQAIKNLRNNLNEFSCPELGRTSLNLAFLRGGLNLGNNGGKIIMGSQGNNIADIAEFVLDIRTASNELSPKIIIKNINDFLSLKSLSLLKANVRHDLRPWLTKKEEIIEIINIIKNKTKIEFSDPGNSGFYDIQMFWQTFGQVPCMRFGAGEEMYTHKPNEFVKINELKKAEEILLEIINQKGK